MSNPESEFRNAPPARLDGIDVCRDLAGPTSLRAADSEGEPAAEGTSADASPGTMYGTFSTFDDWYEINSFWEGQFLERIAPGAFKRTIKNRSGGSPVRVLLDHGFDPELGDRPLGIPEVLEERDAGAYAEVPLFSGVPQMVVSGLRAGAYGQSFRFQVLRDEWVEEPDASDANPKGIAERTIKEVRLIEFGPTAFPANPGTEVGLRSTTDDFYEKLRRRDAVTYDQALARTKEIRTPASAEPATPAAPADPAITPSLPLRTPDTGPANDSATSATPAAPDDSPTARNSENSPVTGHSEDAPAARHSEATDRPAARARVTPSSPEGPIMSADLEPMTSEEREARQSEIRSRLQELDNEFNGAALPAETQTEWDSLNTEFDDNERAIAADVKRKARLQDMAARQAGETAASMSVPHVVGRRPDNLFDLAGIRQRARSIDEVPALYRDAALRIVEEARYPDATRKTEAVDRAQYLLEYVDDNLGTLARRIITTGSPTYMRAFGKAVTALSTNGLTSEEQRALAMGAGSTGAFAVPFTLDPTVILTSTGVNNPIRAVARVETITGQQWQGVTSAGITVSRAAEAAPTTDNAPTLAQPTVTPSRVQGFVPFSIEVDQDWSGLQNEMTRLLADAKNVEEATAFINGNGTPPNPGGLINTLNVSQNVTANTITLATVYALESGLNPRFRGNATFLASKSVYNAIRQIDTTGGSQLWERVGNSQPNQLLGYNAYEISTMTAGTTINDRWLLFGDCSQFLIVDRVGMSVELVPHLFRQAVAGAGFGLPTGQRGLFAMWRNNSKVLVDGAFLIAFKAA